MTERNRPDRALVERIVREEARAYGVTESAVLGKSNQPRAYDARKSAICRILIQTGCSKIGLAEVWGCTAETVFAALRAPAPFALAYDARTAAQIHWLYPDRAPGILDGRDPATNADLALWRDFGRKDAAA